MAAFTPYSAIARHGVIGDRRTAALVSADGTIDWLCLPDYDGHVVFGALLDARRGGFWRIGPAALCAGHQRYDPVTPILRTSWSTAEYDVDVTDAMAMPHDGRAPGHDGDRIVLRRLRCTRGTAECVSIFTPSFDFEPVAAAVAGTLPSGVRYAFWASRPEWCTLCTTAHLTSGSTVWMIFAVGEPRDWDESVAAGLLEEIETFWANATRAIGGKRVDPRIRQSATLLRLLEYVPAGSIVAAPTTSVPERIGGGWNADYRLTWVRDASLAMATLAALGDLESAGRYLGWLASLDATTNGPLQVTYDIRGGLTPRQRSRRDLDGYRGSKPVRFGNHAYLQHQLDIYGYLADCVLTYLEQGGRWDERVWQLLVRSADYIVAHWDEAGNGLWELAPVQHYTSSRVMCWTALDRILTIAGRLDDAHPNAEHWRAACDAIKRAVETDGWSERLGAFKQSIETDALDASALLIPIVGFLQASDPRVVATVDRIAERLTIDGYVYRFDPDEVPQVGPSPMGEFEGAFLPCTFWLATAFAKMGRRDAASSIVQRVEAAAGPLGILAEAIDPRTSVLLGNTPLLFSHVEHIRALRALAAAEESARAS